MNAKIIDGKALAQSVRAGLKEKVEQFKLSSRAPGLTVILVGDNPASQVYVRNKIKACTDVGITSKLEKLPAETSEAELLALLEKLNADDSVDGILVQLPCPVISTSKKSLRLSARTKTSTASMLPMSALLLQASAVSAAARHTASSKCWNPWTILSPAPTLWSSAEAILSGNPWRLCCLRKMRLSPSLTAKRRI